MEGNRLKMREAIESAIGLCIDAIEGGEYMGEGPDPAFEKIKKVLSAAVAEPARQCDVGTPEEQRKKFRLFCESHKPTESEFTEAGELLCPASGCELGVCNYGQCALKWAQTPCAAKEGVATP